MVLQVVLEISSENDSAEVTKIAIMLLLVSRQFLVVLKHFRTPFMFAFQEFFLFFDQLQIVILRSKLLHDIEIFICFNFELELELIIAENFLLDFDILLDFEMFLDFNQLYFDYQVSKGWVGLMIITNILFHILHGLLSDSSFLSVFSRFVGDFFVFLLLIVNASI